MKIRMIKGSYRDAAEDVKNRIGKAGSATGQKKNKTRDGVIIILGLIMFTLVLGGFGFNKYQFGMASLDWPAVEGEIIQSKVVHERKDSKDQYTPVVSYSYTVEGKEHIGGRLSSDDQRMKYSSKASEKLEDFPVGARVSVYYKPDEPQRALLIPGVQKTTWYLLSAAAACLFLAVMVSFSLIKRRFGRK